MHGAFEAVEGADAAALLLAAGSAASARASALLARRIDTETSFRGTTWVIAGEETCNTRS
jgi:hypothetical protein